MPERQRRPQVSIGVDVIEDAGDWTALGDCAAIIQAAAAAVARQPKIVSGEVHVCVALSSDANVAALNGQFRGKPTPTNVLSFPAGTGAEPGFLGDIVLAGETVAREASEQATPLAHHIQHLVAHGVLHLLGFDHESETDAERMEALEIEILARLGIANPYTGALEAVKTGATGERPAKPRP